MAPDQTRAEQIAAITPAEVADFIRYLTLDRGGSYSMVTTCPRAEGRKLALAKRNLESYVAWKPAKRTRRLRPVIEIIDRIVKAAVVDEGHDAVTFSFAAEEVVLLRGAMGVLTDFELTKAADARGRRGRR